VGGAVPAAFPGRDVSSSLAWLVVGAAGLAADRPAIGAAPCEPAQMRSDRRWLSCCAIQPTNPRARPGPPVIRSANFPWCC